MYDSIDAENVNIQGLALGDEETEADLFFVEGRQTGCNSLRPPEIAEPNICDPGRVRRLDNDCVMQGLTVWISSSSMWKEGELESSEVPRVCSNVVPRPSS